MSTGFEYLDHTADIAVRLTAPTIPGLFKVAAEALKASLAENVSFKTIETKRINLNEYSVEELLVSFLNELNFLLSVRKFVLKSITGLVIEEYEDIWQLKAECEGSYNPEFIPKYEVKGVTFHQMEIKFEDGNYITVVVFDI